ncbi:glycosyltransferase [Pedobacter rhizosphaerae]|uniref:Glycosyl transferase family 2 n=1 Tax=Pedobacter rhizosphaerae TaxID=390241 RepID=A0A1H9SIR7_9SPHI|nr:glycosyltransferase [Pedobacter rhizosphaerae]SER84545.1 Glycosyl transferase family 2 [Pedobacter rhizosphaerae]
MNNSIIIGVFCYNRASKLKRCMEALLTNPECSEMDIIFFSDGPKKGADPKPVAEVRDYIDGLKGFKSVTKHYREENLSTGPNFRAGLTYLSNHYERFIIVEDDLIVSSNYIKFLSDALEFYQHDLSVFCVTAYVFPVNYQDYPYDTIVYKRFCSYGWAGWGNRLPAVIWEETALKQLMKNSPNFKSRLNAEGHDLVRMLKKQIKGKISTWDIQMQVHVAENRLKVIYPTLSKVSNIGFDEESTNTSGVNYLISPLDPGNQRTFNFSPASNIIPDLQRQIKAPYAYKTLVIRKLRNEFIKLSNRIAKVSK